MRYKLYRYTIQNQENRIVGPDRHFRLFEQSKGPNAYGELAEYRGRRDTILMHVRRYNSDFSGLVGRHSIEREVAAYVATDDEVQTKVERDDDYPHTPFVCFPRLGLIACVEGRSVLADSAMSRLHQILGFRQKVLFVVESIREPIDLRKAIHRFNVTEVTFEILPVNPHTGDLGLALDESRMEDHVKKIRGKAEATRDDPIQLNGGFVTAVQQLQLSGHAKVGFKGFGDGGVEVVVPKPSLAKELAEDEGDVVAGETVDIKIDFPGPAQEYPFTQGHVTNVRTISRRLTDKDDDQ